MIRSARAALVRTVTVGPGVLDRSSPPAAAVGSRALTAGAEFHRVTWHVHDHCAKGAHRSAIRWPRESGHGSAGRTSCGRSRTRCSCCALLDNEVADRLEYDEEGSSFVPGRGYPQAHDVALDVATGICVEIHAV